MKNIVWIPFAVACASKPEANWDDGSGDAPPTDIWGAGTEDDSPTGSGGDEPEPGTDVEDTAIPMVGGVFEDFINVTELPGGDVSCFIGSLATETAAENCVAQRSMAGQVMDFQDDVPVDEARVEFFWADAIFGTPDEVVTADANGAFNVEMNTCEPFAYRVTTEPILDATKITLESHDVLPNKGSINPVSHAINSVSSTTYALIPNLLGVIPDTTKGIVAGRVYDCSGDTLEGLQVVVDDGLGNIPEGVVPKYFIDDFPNRNQAYTSSDGLWILLDVPTGNWRVRGYVADGLGGHLLISQTEVDVQEDSINIASLYVGIEDGVKMPVDCLTECS